MGKKRRSDSLGNTPTKMKQNRGDDLMVARDRLKGALEDLLNSEEESSSEEEAPVTPSKSVAIKKEPVIRPPVIRRRKRKQTVDLELAFHHTFVMKLFDRAVDLAQFKEDTPLYPICRAWIANQPRVPPPIPNLESQGIKKEDDELFEFDTEEVKDIPKLPPPSCPPLGSRIPFISPTHVQDISLDYSSENLPTAEELLNGHLSKWAGIRRDWIKSAQLNESRFEQSGRLLSNMYKRAQNSFNT